ncbi:20987_t:CDS:2, partial [Racocetra persica]
CLLFEIYASSDLPLKEVVLNKQISLELVRSIRKRISPKTIVNFTSNYSGCLYRVFDKDIAIKILHVSNILTDNLKTISKTEFNFNNIFNNNKSLTQVAYHDLCFNSNDIRMCVNLCDSQNLKNGFTISDQLVKYVFKHSKKYCLDIDKEFSQIKIIKESPDS